MRIHSIGIGGIGVSALAQYYLEKGNKVSGSDLNDSEIISLLKNKGAEVFLGHSDKIIEKIYSDAINNQDKLWVIYSPAIEKTNPELNKAIELAEKDNSIKVMSYPEALGELTKSYFTIAVSGTHGKSTTSSMIGLALIKAGLDPTVIVGTKLREFGDSNFRAGNSNLLVIEADEFKASFLNYYPNVLVLTNIEEDHLDYYENLDNIIKAFRDYLLKVKDNGILIANRDDKNIEMLLKDGAIKKSKVKRVIYYSLEQPEAGIIKQRIKLPGEHNISNSLAVLSLVEVLEVKKEILIEGISEFRGTWRRFEEKEGDIFGKKVKIISDYGHHPTEIMATVKAAREKYPEKKILLIFQPHQYQRTYYLYNSFKDTFKKMVEGGKNNNGFIDKAVITDIFSVPGREREEIKRKVNAKKLVDEIGSNKVIYWLKDRLGEFLKDEVRGGEVVIIMGAGDIYNLAKKFYC